MLLKERKNLNSKGRSMTVLIIGNFLRTKIIFIFVLDRNKSFESPDKKNSIFSLRKNQVRRSLIEMDPIMSPKTVKSSSME